MAMAVAMAHVSGGFAGGWIGMVAELGGLVDGFLMESFA